MKIENSIYLWLHRSNLSKTKGNFFQRLFPNPVYSSTKASARRFSRWGEKLFHNETQFSCFRLQNASSLLTLCQLDNLAAWFFMRLSFYWRHCNLPGHFTGNSQCKVWDTDGGAWLWPGVVHIHPSNAGHSSQEGGCFHITKRSFFKLFF